MKSNLEGRTVAAPIRATIPATEVRTIQSRIVHQEYRISVALPNSYRSKPRRRYPTIYLLDGNWLFGLVTDLTRIMSRGPNFPEAIVVGIGYPVDADEPLDAAFIRVAKSRTPDLTPVVDRKMVEETARVHKVDITTGGSGKFLNFMQTELIPFIEANYRARSTGRTLMGHSLGGLFVLYALFHQPKLFNGYLAVDASLFYRDKAMFNIERRFARAHTALSAKLYLGIGEPDKDHSPSDMVAHFLEFAARLESRHYKGLRLTQQIHFGCDHGSVVAPGFQAGLQAVAA